MSSVLLDGLECTSKVQQGSFQQLKLCRAICSKSWTKICHGSDGVSLRAADDLEIVRELASTGGVILGRAQWGTPSV